MSDQQPRGDEPRAEQPPTGWSPPPQPPSSPAGPEGTGTGSGGASTGPRGGGAPQGDPFAGGPYGGGDQRTAGTYGSGYGQQAPRPAGTDDLRPADQRMWATLTHVAGIVVPVLGPLVAFLVLKDRGLFVRDQTKEALNAHISLALYFVGLYIAFGILSLITLGLFSPLLALPPLLWFPLVLFGILAAVAANRGERYRYPLVVRFVR
ncbi:DUF4870 domain-containing protein [Pseudokineococcus marinus]|uniref:DUF4870 domain-containing protein n=1 Tax=Pseudokineococcus marinus TaxID=351215 RepID=A0A849BZ66_9ACTN|nr:DUF4870 domain-containing protein [Pseudokineococcus marinus]NNH22788.1 DUF4870 domain-containing protein [Pseudokineococcus marinus]